MLTGSVCGAVTGGLMALGLADASSQLAMEFQRRLKENHDGSLDCNVLLDRWAKLGNTNRKPHCDEMCFECMTLVEELLGVVE